MNFYKIIVVIFVILSDKSVYGLKGPNVCQEEERYIEHVRTPFKKPVQVRDYEWCLKFPPRCEVDKTIYVDDYDVREEERVRYIEKCCPGYEHDLKSDKCVSLKCKQCLNGICNPSTGYCQCFRGFAGDSCNETRSIIHIRKWNNPSFVTSVPGKVFITKINTTDISVSSQNDNIKIRSTTVSPIIGTYPADYLIIKPIENQIFQSETNKDSATVKNPFKYPTEYEEHSKVSKSLSETNTDSPISENFLKYSQELPKIAQISKNRIFMERSPQDFKNVNAATETVPAISSTSIASSLETGTSSGYLEDILPIEETFEDTLEDEMLKLESNNDVVNNSSKFSLLQFDTSESNTDTFEPKTTKPDTNIPISETVQENSKEDTEDIPNFVTEKTLSIEFITESISDHSETSNDGIKINNNSTTDIPYPAFYITGNVPKFTEETDFVKPSTDDIAVTKSLRDDEEQESPTFASSTPKSLDNLTDHKLTEQKTLTSGPYINSPLLKYPPRYLEDVRMFEDVILETTSSTPKHTADTWSTGTTLSDEEEVGKVTKAVTTQDTPTEEKSEGDNKDQLPFTPSIFEDDELEMEIIAIKHLENETENHFDLENSSSPASIDFSSKSESTVANTPDYNTTDNSTLSSPIQTFRKINEIPYYSFLLAELSFYGGVLFTILAITTGFIVFYVVKRKIDDPESGAYRVHPYKKEETRWSQIIHCFRRQSNEIPEPCTEEEYKDHSTHTIYFLKDKNGVLTQVPDIKSILNPTFTAEPESTLGNLINAKTDQLITDNLRMIYDSTYDHPSLKYYINNSFVGSTFLTAEEKNINLLDHIYDEIPAWKQKISSSESLNNSNGEDDQDQTIYVTKDVTPEIAATKL